MHLRKKNDMDLEERIKMYNEAYRKGEALISDAEYDKLLELLKEENPESELLKKAVIEDSSKDRMEALPYPMFSLEKVKTIQELYRWMESCNFQSQDSLIITPKFDGISLLVNEECCSAWTRGNGVEGQRSDEHYRVMKGNAHIKKVSDFKFSYGEAIFSKKDFLENKGEYKSARNCVAGLFNSPDVSLMLKHAVLARYGTDRDDLDKNTQLSLLKQSYPYTSPWILTTYGSFLTNEGDVRKWLDDIFNMLSTEYKCDGLVIEVDSALKRHSLGRLPNNNPRYAIAYKDPEWAERADTVVKDIEWNISKDGKAKPVIIFDSVELCGATVKRATAHNARYLVENHICKGALITIARSGDVIPKHLKTLSYSKDAFFQQMAIMMPCPSCGNIMSWDETQTELVCKSTFCKEKEISKFVYFFTTLGMKEFGEPTIRKIWEAGFRSIRSFFDLEFSDLNQIEGIGESVSKSILTQFKKILEKGVPFARLLTAYNVFNGKIAEKTCQMILDNLSEEDLKAIKDNSDIPDDHLTAIHGVSEKIAGSFNEGLLVFAYKVDNPIKISFYSKPKVKTVGGELMRVCFSGIRSIAAESWLESHGHIVVSNVSSKTTYLVVKTIGSSTSKEVKASKLGIKIITIEEFEQLMKEIDESIL